MIVSQEFIGVAQGSCVLHLYTTDLQTVESIIFIRIIRKSWNRLTQNIAEVRKSSHTQRRVT